jgi:hypothetical protein
MSIDLSGLASAIVTISVNKTNLEKYLSVVRLTKLLCIMQGDKKKIKELEKQEKDIIEIIKIIEYCDREAVVVYKGIKTKVEKLKYVLVKYENEALKIATDIFMKSSSSETIPLPKIEIGEKELEVLKSLPEEIRERFGINGNATS